MGALKSGVWKPTPDEVRRIVTEMRPIIEDFSRKAEQACRRADLETAAGAAR
ncbi:MAG: hypothetical protein QOI20_1441 [Acidimicrobiaceae bacterium]|jgi:hypothetical protein|nr:hypothetical protein [Acidimicrobiaceae bacterium]